MDFLPARRSGDGFYLGGQKLLLGGQDVPADANLLMLRPERVALLAEGEVAGADDNVFAGHIHDIIYQGDSVLVQVGLEGGQLIAARVGSARAAIRALPRVGDAVRLALAAHDVCLLHDDAG